MLELAEHDDQQPWSWSYRTPHCGKSKGAKRADSTTSMKTWTTKKLRVSQLLRQTGTAQRPGPGQPATSSPTLPIAKTASSRRSATEYHPSAQTQLTAAGLASCLQ
jgi:hypothetical protein